MHHSEYRSSRARKGDQCAPCRHARDKRFGAVDRIEHPHEFGVAAFGTEFLADNSMSWKLLSDQCAHRLLGRPVSGCYRIERAAATALVFDAERSAEEGSDGIPRYGRKLVDKSSEIHSGHLLRPSTRVVMTSYISVAAWAIGRPSPRFWAPSKNIFPRTSFKAVSEPALPERLCLIIRWLRSPQNRCCQVS